MTTINGETFYTPKEIADKKLIVNGKGNSDYGFILRLIKAGKLDGKVFNNGTKISYYIVSEKEVERYNSQFSA